MGLAHDPGFGAGVAHVDLGAENLGLDGDAQGHADGFETGDASRRQGQSGHGGGVVMRLREGVSGERHDLFGRRGHAAARANHRRAVHLPPRQRAEKPLAAVHGQYRP